jgi:hypothetical protein
MGRLFLEYPDSSEIYTCKDCSVPITTKESIASKDYKGVNGHTAYLFTNIMNVIRTPPEPKRFLTGVA